MAYLKTITQSLDRENRVELEGRKKDKWALDYDM